MTLGEYFKDNKIDKKICILMIADNGKLMSPMEFKKVSNIKGELLNREFMESNDEDDVVEIWVM